MFDPPSDPYGDEKNCRVCDAAMEYDPWQKEWFCPSDHSDNEGVDENELADELA